MLVAAWVYPGRSALQSAEQGVRDAVSATTKRMFNIDKLCKNVQKATSTKFLTSQTNTTGTETKHKRRKRLHGSKLKQSRQKARCNRRKRALVKPKGSTCARVGVQTKEEGFGETRRKHLCRSQSVHRNPWRMFGTSRVFSGHNKRKGFIEKPNLRKRRSARKTLEQFHSRR